MRIFLRVFILFLSLVSATSHAWVPNGDTVTIDEIIQWEGDQKIYFKLSNNYICYIPSSEKNTYALILALYMAGKKASVHCHDSEESTSGIKGHKLHRIIAVKQ